MQRPGFDSWLGQVKYFRSTTFAFLFNCTPVGRNADSMTEPRSQFRLKNFSIDVLSVVEPNGGLIVGVLLLQYSIVYTVVSLSLFHLLLYRDLNLLDDTSIR